MQLTIGYWHSCTSVSQIWYLFVKDDWWISWSLFSLSWLEWCWSLTQLYADQRVQLLMVMRDIADIAVLLLYSCILSKFWFYRMIKVASAILSYDWQCSFLWIIIYSFKYFTLNGELWLFFPDIIVHLRWSFSILFNFLFHFSYLTN